MKQHLLFLALSFYTLGAHAAVSIDVKIQQKIGGNIVETTRKISSNYNEDIVISSFGLDNSIILKLQKFSKINVNGTSISPVQVDLKLIDETQALVGKPHTVTSFYNQSAEFNLPSNGVIESGADLNVSLIFKEMN
jgi:hypothetical protein